MRETLLKWAETELREFPWRDRSLSLYEVFLAEFFLTQTPAENVADVYPSFREIYPDLDALEEATRDELESAVEPLGFQRMRSEALNEIADEYEELPRDPDELRELPRVGPYVADTTLCFALDEPLPILDRNVVRVYDRLFGGEFPNTESDRREFAGGVVPDGGREARRYNLALLDFGALVCTKRDPECGTCPFRPTCAYVS